jgi:5-methylcytosine-specific restriction endonuclease McrA
MTRRRFFSSHDRFILRLTAFNRCERCGARFKHGFEADHVKPFSRGGETELENGQALCPTCNREKGSHFQP